MRQTALIYLHVTARLQLIIFFKRRTSRELNFNTRFRLPSSLRAVKYNFNILVNSQMQCSHVIQTQAQKCDGMHINSDAVYQGDSKFERETSKTQTALIGPKYIQIIYVFGSASESKPVHSRYSRLIIIIIIIIIILY